MGTISFLGLVLGIGYFLFLLFISIRWKASPTSSFSEDFRPSSPLSVLIAAKNEASNVQALANALLAQDYPKELVEFILIDDHSTDETAAIWENLQLPDNFSLRRSSNTPGKKSAITAGITFAKHEIIVTTDADCVPNPNWLRSIAHLMESSQPKFIAGPVQFHKETSFFEQFQSLDFLGMMLFTGVGIEDQLFFMANGANMAFQKSAFEMVCGYEGNMHIASGDDMFLVHKIAKHFPKGAIKFNKNKEALVSTKAEPTLSGFINQRIRWGGKNKASSDGLLIIILAWVMLTALWLLIFPLANFWWVVLVLKLIGDFALLYVATSFFERRPLLRSFVPSFVLHTIYVASIGLLSLVWRGKWQK